MPASEGKFLTAAKQMNKRLVIRCSHKKHEKESIVRRILSLQLLQLFPCAGPEENKSVHNNL